jgi:hypothetical protein
VGFILDVILRKCEQVFRSGYRYFKSLYYIICPII